ncbi:MAG: TM0106 family RecB-like putative nuclease [Deltaproteobacteria bacterium]|nr:TM0106 family RecB-like putative nuclease [Deltaproteobacteria bacterium]
MIRLTASDFYTFFRPARCELRIYLKEIGKEEAAPGPYEEVLLRLGERHESSHLATFSDWMDLSKGPLEDREYTTRDAVKSGAPVLYQPAFKVVHEIGGKEYEIVGEPDFLIKDGSNYIIRDSKISRRINEKDHPEILRQLELYGWLYEETFKKLPKALQVHSGTGDIIELPYDGGSTALALMEDIANLKIAKFGTYSPVGWSKCGGCPFQNHCWPIAEANRDVSLVPGVDQNLALALREEGVRTIEQLLNSFDEQRLADFKRPWGNTLQKVGKKAKSIIRMAKAIYENEEIMIQPPSIPDRPSYVMFDLEGLPPQLDELEKIYLWGVQVYGEKMSDFMPALAGFGEEGDKEGWEQFLKNAATIFSEYGDLPCVHWHHYELVKIDLYIKRYGDRDGIAERVKRNLLDLLPITQRSIALPLPSYSLKVIEKYVGFKRTLDEYRGDTAIARYIEAVETEDQKQREKIMDEILEYNKEDLEATWTVLKWLRSKAT